MKIPRNLLVFSILKNIRRYATKPKLSVRMDAQVLNRLESEEIKPRKHPGVMTINVAEVPSEIIKAMEVALIGKPLKAVLDEGKLLSEFLKARHSPPEEEEIKFQGDRLQQKIEIQHGIDSSILSMEEKEKLKLQYKDLVERRLHNMFRFWKPIQYDEHRSLQYMVARFAPEYAVLRRIFTEIKNRDPNFQPQSLFDFGSGVGTVTWASRSVWDNSVKEYFNVDISGDMNDLAGALLKHVLGEENVPKGLFYRQFLPASHKLKYDTVVSAYTLLDLPSTKSRLQTLVNLWNKTQNYLVLVEQGTNAGFKVINEAREFVLHLSKNKEGDITTAPSAHVFSPCPHDMTCPRFVHHTTPCNFEVSYMPLSFEHKGRTWKERFSYVVLKKGTRQISDTQWPRIVGPTLVRKKHAICRMCVAGGSLEEVIFTASKHGTIPYRCARSSNWGDLLPITLEQKTQEN